MVNDLSEKWESYKCEFEKWKTEMQHESIVYQQVNMQGQAAMKAALLINGGAAVAMLAFIGTAINKGTVNPLLYKFCSSMMMFIFGVLSGALAFGVTYIAGLVNASIIADHSAKKIVIWWIINSIAIIFTVFAYVLFVAGSLNAYCAFTNILSA